MRTITRLWKSFRRLGDLYQLAAIIALLVVLGMMVPKKAKAQDDEGDIAVQVEGKCLNGRLVGLRLFAPRVGVIVIPIPENVCQGVVPQKRPAREA